MSATEIVWLYSHGKRRHIASSEPGGKYSRPSLCGGWFAPEAAKFEEQRRWNGEFAAERRILRLRELPVCRQCTAAQEKLQTSEARS